MTSEVLQRNSAEQEILQSLQMTGIQRRKGEEQLYNKYHFLISFGVKKYSLTEEQIFDAYSDTILAAIESITSGSFRGASSLSTFIYQIFKYKCIDILRKNSSHRSRVHRTLDIVGKLMNISDPADTVIEQINKKADAEIFKQQLNKLCDKSRRLLMLSAEGYTDKEIAMEMKFKTRDVVKTSRLRCIRTLRQLNTAC